MDDPKLDDLTLIRVHFRGLPTDECPWYRVDADTLTQMAADWERDETRSQRDRSSSDHRAAHAPDRNWHVYQVYSERRTPHLHPLILCFEDVLFIG